MLICAKSYLNLTLNAPYVRNLLPCTSAIYPWNINICTQFSRPRAGVPPHQCRCTPPPTSVPYSVSCNFMSIMVTTNSHHTFRLLQKRACSNLKKKDDQPSLPSYVRYAIYMTTIRFNKKIC